MLGKCGGNITLWNNHRLPAKIKNVSLSPDKDLIAAQVETDRLVILRPDACVKRFEIPTGGVALSWAQNGRFIAVGLKTGEIILYEAELGRKVYHFLCPLFENLGGLKQLVWLNESQKECSEVPIDTEENGLPTDLKGFTNISDLLEKLELGWSEQSNELETDLEGLIVDVNKAIFTGEEMCKFLDLSSIRDVNDELRYGGIIQSSRTIDDLLGEIVTLWEDGSARACVGLFSYLKFNFPKSIEGSRYSTVLAEQDSCKSILNFLVLSENGSRNLCCYTFSSIKPPLVLKMIESISRKIFTVIAVLSNEINVLESIYNTIGKSIRSKMEVYKTLSEEMGSTGSFTTNLLFFLFTGRGINEVCEQFIIREVCDLKKFRKWNSSLKQNFESIRLTIYRRCIPLLQHLLMCILDLKSWLKCQLLLSLRLNYEAETLNSAINIIHTLMITLSQLEEDSAIVQRCLGSFCNWLLKESIDLELSPSNPEAIDTEYEDFVVSDAVLFMYTLFNEKSEFETEEVAELLEFLIPSNSEEHHLRWDKYFSEGVQHNLSEGSPELMWDSYKCKDSSMSSSLWTQFSGLKTLLFNLMRSMATSTEKELEPCFAIKLNDAQIIEPLSSYIKLSPSHDYTSTFAANNTFTMAHINKLFNSLPAVGINVQFFEYSNIKTGMNLKKASKLINTFDLKLILASDVSTTISKSHIEDKRTDIRIIDLLLYDGSTIFLLYSQNISSGNIVFTVDQ